MWSLCIQGRTILPLILLPCNKLTWLSIRVTFCSKRPDCRYACIYFLRTVQQFAKMAHTHIYKHVSVYVYNIHVGQALGHLLASCKCTLAYSRVTSHVLSPCTSLPMKGRWLWRDFAAHFPGAGNASGGMVPTSPQAT